MLSKRQQSDGCKDKNHIMKKKEDIIRIDFPKNKDLNEEELRELEEAAKRPIVFTEDAPELSDEQYAQMAALARKRNAKNNAIRTA